MNNSLAAKWKSASMLMKIVVVNAAVFLILNVANIILLFAGIDDASAIVESWVSLPARIPALLRHPWTLLTYMFSQIEPLHLLFNMLWLYWFGAVFLLLSTPRRFLGLYLLGGFGGALIYLVVFNIAPFFAGTNGYLIGSSASVIAIVTATAFMAPDYKMNLLFLGAVSLKWIAVVTIGIDLVSVTGSNAGGHLAHLGGALTGALYALLLRRGVDLTAPLSRLFADERQSFRPSRHARRQARRAPASGSGRERKGPGASAADQAELDAILDKIKKSGYTSLTPEERARLFDVSRRL